MGADILVVVVVDSWAEQDIEADKAQHGHSSAIEQLSRGVNKRTEGAVLRLIL